ncbi:MAG TPA: glycosyltransferase [Sedimenticola thiotaurini]|uniref:Glycosyltransferase n=1 Tax=Sedimenticola thiotaurini TaxID=1543721 RepID=A0A831RPR9_9GAMM|nr:glycosyltransferase [Sedimenticola thiotaurini]
MAAAVTAGSATGRPLTVLQLLPDLRGGGVERGTLEVADELVRRGHRSLVISNGGELVQPLEAGGSEHLCWPIGVKSLRTLALVPGLRRLLRQRQVDIVHARSRLPAWILWLAWRGMDPARRPRLVTTVHGLYSVSRYSAVMTRGERVIAVSETVRDYILRNYPETDPGRIELIHRGVDRDAFPRGYTPAESWRTTWYSRYPSLREGPVLTLAGRLTRLKGHHAFIDLVAALRAGGRPVTGLIVGGEDPRRRGYAAELRQRVAELGLERALLFTGQRQDIREIYAVSDLVFSLSGKPESFGRTVVEALSMGVPVIGWDHGGVGEVLARLLPAGAVPLNDGDALLRRTVDFLERPPVVAGFDDFRLQTMLDKTLMLYQALAADRNAAR